MPIDYSKYPLNWKTEIRPRILKRDGNCCKVCKVPNKALVFRGFLNGNEVFQTANADIFSYPSGEFLGNDVFALIEPKSGNPNQKAIKIVLTIAHLDHDTNNNEDSNLAALCQCCHLQHDAKHHQTNARQTREAKMGLQRMF